MRKLKRLFRPLKDPRASNTRHDLVEILIIALAAILLVCIRYALL